MTTNSDQPTPTAWARFRFSVVGSLLSSPPAATENSRPRWRPWPGRPGTHPAHGREVHFSAVAVGRWCCKARRKKDDPVGVLQRALRKDFGKVSLPPRLAERLFAGERPTSTGPTSCTTTTWARRPRPTLRWGRQVRTPPSGGTCRPTAWSASRGRPRALPARSARPGGGKSGRSAATRRSTSAHCGTSTSTTARSRCSRPTASGRSRWPWASSTTARGSAATCSGICRKPPRT